jgi:DNA-binding response OmpR family regulator
MDINLPGISGIEALKILRQDPATAHIPVIALTANAMERDVQKGLKAGFLLYLTKPIKVNAFMGALDSALNISRKTMRRTKSSKTHVTGSASDAIVLLPPVGANDEKSSPGRR